MQLQYAATDAAILLPLRDVLLQDLERAGLGEAATLEWVCLPAVAEMELGTKRSSRKKPDASSRESVESIRSGHQVAL